MLFWTKHFLVQIVLMIQLGETLVNFFLTIYIYIRCNVFIHETLPKWKYEICLIQEGFRGICIIFNNEI